MSNAQAEFEAKFHGAVEARTAAREKLSDVTKSIARLKADAAQANADVAKARADAKAAGVRLPKIAQASASTADATQPDTGADESDD